MTIFYINLIKFYGLDFILQKFQKVGTNKTTLPYLKGYDILKKRYKIKIKRGYMSL